MTKPHASTGTAPSSDSEHWNSGSIGQRGVYALFEQLAHAAGVKTSKTAVAKQVGDSLISVLGPTLFDNPIALTVIASTLVNADLLSGSIASRLDLRPDQVRVFLNEGVDEFIRGMIDGTRRIDANLSVDRQNAELRNIADQQIDKHVRSFARRHPEVLRDVIIIVERGIETWHEISCPVEKPRLKAGVSDVKSGKWTECLDRGIRRAACSCQTKGTLNEIFNQLRDMHQHAKVQAVYAEIADPSYNGVRDQFIQQAGIHGQVTLGDVDRALDASDPALRRSLILSLVGMTATTGAAALATNVVETGKKFLKDFTNPDSPLRQDFDQKAEEYRVGAKKRRRASLGKA